MPPNGNIRIGRGWLSYGRPPGRHGRRDRRLRHLPPPQGVPEREDCGGAQCRRHDVRVEEARRVEDTSDDQSGGTTGVGDLIARWPVTGPFKIKAQVGDRVLGLGFRRWSG